MMLQTEKKREARDLKQPFSQDQVKDNLLYKNYSIDMANKHSFNPLKLKESNQKVNISLLNNENKTIQKKEYRKTSSQENIIGIAETQTGLPMDDVRVHYNSQKPAQLQASAYTKGNEIFVGPGQEKHLSHEVWHVVQQKQGRVSPTTQVDGQMVNDEKELEHEADSMGKKLESRSSINVTAQQVSRHRSAIQMMRDGVGNKINTLKNLVDYLNPVSVKKSKKAKISETAKGPSDAEELTEIWVNYSENDDVISKLNAVIQQEALDASDENNVKTITSKVKKKLKEAVKGRVEQSKESPEESEQTEALQESLSDTFEVDIPDKIKKQAEQLGEVPHRNYIKIIQAMQNGERLGSNVHSLEGARAGQFSVDISGVGGGRGKGRLIFTRKGRTYNIIELLEEHDY